MTIEIISMQITDRERGAVRMIARDVSEERLQFLERVRDDGFEEEVIYEWKTKDSRQFYALRCWLKAQKATRETKTFGQAMTSVIGTITQSPAGKYRIWDL